MASFDFRRKLYSMGLGVLLCVAILRFGKSEAIIEVDQTIGLVCPILTTYGRLNFAISKRSPFLTRMCLAEGADPNGRGLELDTPLMEACQDEEDFDIVALLIEGGADPNLQDVDGYTALMFATSASSTRTVKLLLDHGANISLKVHGKDPRGEGEDEGYTALLFACRNGDVDIVKLLMERGANPGETNRRGLDALEIARRAESRKVVTYLEQLSSSEKD